MSRARHHNSLMTSRDSGYTTKELSKTTWPDFERLFTQGNGWDHCWCMAFQRDRSRARASKRTRAERSVRNRADKKRLVEEEAAQGILVYADGEPVGWCQYGPAHQLLSVDRRKTPGRLTEAGTRDRLWRITCFVTSKKHRRKGVAGIALRAAMEAIRAKGGGLVEGYPVAHWHIDRELGQLVRKYGSMSSEVRRHRAARTRPAGVFVHEIGPVEPAHGGFGNVSTQGTVSMFEKAGFKAVAVIARTHVLMQRTV
jgi:ribosomal protein S18 acetylase RimI-like enzyme